MKHTQRLASGGHGQTHVNAESACLSRSVDASETLTIAGECQDRRVVQHQHAVVRLAPNASLLRVRAVHRLEAHLFVVQEPVQALELPLTPHRLGKTQAGIACQLTCAMRSSRLPRRGSPSDAPRYSAPISSSFIKEL